MAGLIIGGADGDNADNTEHGSLYTSSNIQDPPVPRRPAPPPPAGTIEYPSGENIQDQNPKKQPKEDEDTTVHAESIVDVDVAARLQQLQETTPTKMGMGWTLTSAPGYLDLDSDHENRRRKRLKGLKRLKSGPASERKAQPNKSRGRNFMDFLAGAKEPERKKLLKEDGESDSDWGPYNN